MTSASRPARPCARALPFALLALAAPLAPAQDGSGEAAGEPPSSGRGLERRTAELEDEARRELEAGNAEAAHALLSELLVLRALERARADFREGVPEDGLLHVDRALELDPKSEAAWLLSGEGNLLLAQKSIDQGRAGPLTETAFLDAERAFGRAGESARSLFGRSRAAYMTSRGADALAYAERAFALLEERADAGTASDGDPLAVDPGLERAAWDLDPHRVAADAAFLAYREAREARDEAEAAGRPPEELDALAATAAERFARTEELLASRLARAPHDPEVPSRLADLYLWDGRPERAIETLETALDRIPDDAGLLGRLVEIARNAGASESDAGGRRAAIARLNAFVAEHPEVATAHFLLGREVFELALSAYERQQYFPEEFARCEASFARARELDRSLASECLQWEVVCRNARGWCLYSMDDLEGAKRAFLSMEELFEGGLRWGWEGRLPIGTKSLELVASKLNERGDYAAAAGVYEELVAYDPKSASWWNDLAYFRREASLVVERDAHAIRHLLAPEPEGGAPPDAERFARLRERAGIQPAAWGTEDERAALAATAERWNAEALALMEGSHEAYRRASELAPEDVRVVNDTALILVYYLQRDLDEAERTLLRCVEMGEEQLASDALDEDARWELENAWGDAHQNLGVLYRARLGERERARPWFEKSIEIGPEPRPAVEAYWLPMCAPDWRFETASFASPRERAVVHDLLRPFFGAPCD